MTRLLSRFKHIVRTVPTVNEAKTLIDHHMYDFVILDIMLPDGDGTDVFKHIRTKMWQPHVIICTGIADGQKMDQIMALHPLAVFPKPVDVTKLIQLLEG